MDKETIKIFVICILLSLATLIFIIGTCEFLDYQSCKQRAEVHKSIKYIYKFPAGCLSKYSWED